MRTLVFILSSVLTPFAWAQDTESAKSAEPAPIVTLQTVMVTGVQPGPGLWKVSNGESIVWILGSISPLPKRLEWEPRYVEDALISSQQILAPPGISFDADVGFFKSLTLIPSALKARKNPDDKYLDDVLPAELYARWLVQKELYVGRDRSIEKWRPIFAASKLFDEALDDMDMVQSNVAWDYVSKFGKKTKKPIIETGFSITIEDPRKSLKAFAKSSVEDEACMAATLERLETDLRNMQYRANAWSVGDIQTLRELSYPRNELVCVMAMLQSEVAQDLGMKDAREQIRQSWLTAMEKALNSDKTSFAVLSMSQLLGEQGYLAELRTRGYVIEEPKDPYAPENPELAQSTLDADPAQ